jgi:uncharacterized protein YjbI with pentapeptide repeats
MNDLPDQIGKEEEYTAFSSETLEDILSAHQKWLDSEGKLGTRANLRGVNLKWIDLHGKNLRLALLEGANLQFAQLKRTNLIDSSLENADLSDAKGLLEEQLAGSNLTAAKLPPHISNFESLNRITDLIKNCKHLQITIILACLYSWLTIATTTDARLLTNSISSPLPIIQTEIPIASFFLVTPFLLLCLYFWFHVSLQECWRSLSQLPAFFPDGKSLDEKVYPWIIEGLLRENFSLLKVKTQSFTWLKVKIFKILAWYLVPITIFLFWERYLSSREKYGTILLSGLFLCTMLFGVYSYRLAISTLNHNPPAFFFNWKIYIPFKTSFGSISILIIFVVTTSFMAFGERPIGLLYLVKNYAILVEEDVSIKPENWDGKETSLVKGANLAGKDLQNALAQKAFFVQADLRQANLRGAKIAGANFQNANLSGANLEKVDAGWGENNKVFFKTEVLIRGIINLNKIIESNSGNLDNANVEKTIRNILDGNYDLGANFHKANLSSANLQESVLVFSNFQDADLSSAKIFKGDLRFSIFTRSRLQHANLEEALLSGSNFEGAQLLGVNLEKGSLEFTNFQNVTFYYIPIPKNDSAKENLDKKIKKILAKTYNDSLFTGNLREAQFGFSDMRGGNFTLVDLYRADLSYADLENAILYKANLEETILKGANVKSANFLLSRFHGADLSEVEGLTQEQVNLACLNETTILPAGLTKPQPCE